MTVNELRDLIKHADGSAQVLVLDGERRDAVPRSFVTGRATRLAYVPDYNFYRSPTDRTQATDEIRPALLIVVGGSLADRHEIDRALNSRLESSREPSES